MKRTSSQPSPSASKMATPAPSVSGRYFFPDRPLLWVNLIPEAAVTSVKVTFVAGAGLAALAGAFGGAAALKASAGSRTTETASRRFAAGFKSQPPAFTDDSAVRG